MVKNPIPAKITELASAIIRLVTTHENKIGSSTQKGHTQAGGAPQAIGTSLSAGTDNGYYARADHVHTINYSNILNKPTTFPPSSHNHDNTYYTKEEVDDLLNDVLLDRVFVDENGDLVIGTTIAGMLLSANKNIIQSNETSTLTATAYDAYSDIVVDQPLQLYKDDTLVGIFNTNNNGQIQYTYTGSGSGKHNFIVRNGRFVSGTYEVLDCIYYDPVTSDTNSNYTINSADGTSIAYDSTNEAMKITCGSNAGRNNVDLRTSNSALSLDDVKGKTVRFKVNISNLNGKPARLKISGNNGDISVTDWFTTDGEYYVDGEIPSDATLVLFQINTANNSSWTTGSIYYFKDFTIYPI